MAKCDQQEIEISNFLGSETQQRTILVTGWYRLGADEFGKPATRLNADRHRFNRRRRYSRTSMSLPAR